MRHKQKKEILVRLGKNIRKRRTALGLSQEKMALIAELDRTYVGAIERGERNVAIINIAKIARALKLRAATLLGGIDGK